MPIAAADPRRSRWIPWTFAVGMGVVVAVNAGMIWAAVSSFTGTTVARPYERGLAYNGVIALQERQDRLGWRSDVAFLPATKGARGGRIELRLADRDGQPLTDMRIVGRLERPLEPALAIDLVFRSPGGGRHVADIDLPRAGQWELVADGSRSDGRMRIRQRFVVP